MDIEYKIIPNFLDDIITRFIYHYFNKNENAIMDFILFIKTKEIEQLTKSSLIPYTCKMVEYTQNITFVNKLNDNALYTVYILIYESHTCDKHFIIQDKSNNKINISLNPGDAIIIRKNIFHEKNIHCGYVLELEYISSLQFLLNNKYENYSYKNLIDIDIQDFWKLDTWKSLTCKKQLTLTSPEYYSIHDFPVFANITPTMMNIFITEANNVYDTISQEDVIFRRKNEWDDTDTIMNLMDTINYYNNGKWILAQYNKEWLNYPLMYYDKPIGGIAEQLCPNIINFLKQCKDIRIAGLSLLKKKGKIEIHTDSTGRSKDALACHICLVGNGTLTVNNKSVLQEPKNIIIFDSEHEHSAENPYDIDRIILYIDFVYSRHFKKQIKKKVKINIYSKNVV